jgi:hypothetical protein
MTDADNETRVLELLDALSNTGKFRRDCDDLDQLAHVLTTIRGLVRTHGDVAIDIQEGVPTIFRGA